MTWANNLARIRRFLRDPDANIWSDTVVRNLFNDAQRDLQQKTGFLEDVQAVRVPPMYEMSYLQDWEWAFLPSNTGNYQALRYHEQAEIVFAYRWEPQAVWGLIEATAPDGGVHFTHPFEAFMGMVPGEIVPLQFPTGFHNAKFVAWDKQPIDFLTLKSIQQDDPSWVGRSGEPFAYWRPDKFENQFCLYPNPSSPVWDDIDGDPDIGGVIFTDEDTVSSEYGTIIDAGGLMSQDLGIATDIIETDDNVLFVYSKTPQEVVSENDESDFPPYLQKYAEHGALERAYAVDNDGQIQSLRDYWAMRKELGLKVIQRFMSLRKQDRDYRLTTKGAPGFRTRRQPRLPDSYPATF
jgi:hypothetical protein